MNPFKKARRLIRDYPRFLDYERLTSTFLMRECFGQEGEDMVLSKILQFLPQGHYVDVGAHHPERYSNTMHFYRKGWRGLNIDPMPGIADLFKTARPDDITLELGVSDKEGSMTYHIFTAPTESQGGGGSAYNTFSPERAKKVEALGVPLIATKNVKVMPLAAILDHYWPKGQEIDFLTVDVETLDLQVLKSNDWTKYRPKVVLAEVLNSKIEEIPLDPVYRFMAERGFKMVAWTGNTCFFKREDFDHTKPPV